MSDIVVVRAKYKNGTEETEITFDKNITGAELIEAVNSSFGLKMKGLTMDNPPGYISGNRLLEEYEIHNASIIFLD